MLTESCLDEQRGAHVLMQWIYRECWMLAISESDLAGTDVYRIIDRDAIRAKGLDADGSSKWPTGT